MTVPLENLSRFGFLTLPSYSMIAAANAIEALRMANRVHGAAAYSWQAVTLDGHPTAASNGLMLTPCAMLSAADRFDILFVVGGVDVRNAVDRNVAAALRKLARDGVALGALCTGTFALAEARLLHGYRCAIHWENLSAIREEFPDVDFVEDFYSIDRDRITCTGGVAPLDMMLTIIQARLGRRVATQIAAQFLIERGRAADERQPKQASAASQTAPRRLADAVRLIEDSVEIADLDRRRGTPGENLHAPTGTAVPQASWHFPRSVRLGDAARSGARTAAADRDAGDRRGHRLRLHFRLAFQHRLSRPLRPRAAHRAAGRQRRRTATLFTADATGGSPCLTPRPSRRAAAAPGAPPSVPRGWPTPSPRCRSSPARSRCTRC